MTEQPTPSQRAGLRDELTAAFRAAAPSLVGEIDKRDVHELADAALAVLYREWPWLQAEAEEQPSDPELRRQLAAAIKALGHSEAAIARVRELHRKASHGDTCVYCTHGQRLGYDTTWPCDTIRAVEAVLIACADDTARQVQRDPIPLPSARRTATAPYASQREADIAYADRQRRNQLAHVDLDDPKRWRYTGRRTAPHAALWLLARIERAPGPCRRLDEDQERRIGKVAESAAERVERALDIAAQRKTLEQRCGCGGRIDVHGGEGRLPLAHCTGCGRIWTEGGMVAA